MARMDRIAMLFVVIVIYSALMNLFLIHTLNNEEESNGGGIMEFKNKIQGFIHRHRHTSQDESADVDVSDHHSEHTQVSHYEDGALSAEAILKAEAALEKTDEKTSVEDVPNSEALNESNESDKEHIIKILKAAGTKITPEIIEQIPTWTEVKSLYGDKPKIVGLEQCSDYQLQIPKKDAYIGPSGLFNTGTNLLADLLLKNCKLPNRQWDPVKNPTTKFPYRMKTGMLYQVPWGKHNPLSWRMDHEARMSPGSIDHEHVLPIVMIKDPYYWMGSLCRHKYATNWFHSKAHCPNLVPNEHDYGHRGITRMTKSIPVRVRYQDRDDMVVQYNSMLDFWNTWYSDYLNEKEFPRIMIRFEDILFHLDEVMTKICECGGGEVKQNKDGMHLKEQAAKKGTVHNGSSGLLSAITKYGSATHRLDGMTKEDVEFANENVSSDLMELFSYTYAPVPNE